MRRRTSAPLAFLLAAPFILAACGSDENPMEPDPAPAPTREILANPSFATNIMEIFARTGCSSGSCHGNGAAGLTINSVAATTHGNLVGQPSSACAGETRVIAGDAANSYLIKKVSGTQACGQRMPIGGQLDNIDIGNLTNWINMGANNN